MALQQFLLSSLFSVALIWFAQGNIIQLNSDNLDQILSSHELVFVNFYADWCRFSQMLNPVFDQAGKKAKTNHPEDGKVAFGRIDCDREGALAARFHVSKYPTLKIFRYGVLVKREYRGQRSVEALNEFVDKQLSVPVTTLNSQDDLFNVDINRRSVIGYFESFDSSDYLAFVRLASSLRDDCKFYAGLRSLSDSEINKVVFRSDQMNEEVFPGETADYNGMITWATKLCVPVVRELTFENAEELTEEGLPFLILFYNPNDMDTPDRFRKTVNDELTDQKTSVNFLIANGIQFSHPLHHLGKTQADLPVLAIDSFRHMYVWSHNPRTDIDKSILIRQFIAELNSGQLHREFHQGPDPTKPPPAPPPVDTKKDEEPAAEAEADKTAAPHIPKDADDDKPTEATKAQQQPVRTSPPESLFRKLAPSRTRYTILRDEL